MGNDFTPGMRVRVKVEKADGYVQPWRNRFKSGRRGTVVSANGGLWAGPRVRVLWDHRYGNNSGWTLDMRPGDLEPVEPPHA